MTEDGNRKKKKKRVLFQNKLNTGHFTEVHFFSVFPSLFSLPSPCLNVPIEIQNSRQSHWKSNARTSQGTPRVSLSLCLFPPLLSCHSPLLKLSFTFYTLLCRVCVCEEHCRRAIVEWVVTGWSSSSLYCSLDQYWDMSDSLPGTWTGTDTPGEMSPAETREEKKKSLKTKRPPRSQRA